MTSTSLDLRSKISTNLDYTRDGVQHGHLTIPHSRNDSPWGSMLMPVSIFKNGEGPSILLTGGNHGDEYEGPIALLKLIQKLDVTKVRGQIIIIPALNYPAVKSGTRLSPLDGANMNRAFPGDPDGSITFMIADYVQRFILSRVDAVIDIHAGGKIMNFLPTAVIHNLPDPDQMARTKAAAEAFGAPNCLILEELDARGMLDTAVEEMGKVFVSTELGGGGTSTPETIRVAEQGIHDTLVHFGALQAAPLGNSRTRFLETPGNAFVIADKAGIFEFACNLGDTVKEGDILARVFDIDRPAEAATEYRAPCDGIVIHRHLAGLINRGDCLSVLGIPV